MDVEDSKEPATTGVNVQLVSRARVIIDLREAAFRRIQE